MATLPLHAMQPHPFAARAHMTVTAGVLIMATRTTISLLQLGPVIFSGTDGIISFLQGKGLLAQQLTCHHCSVAMNIARRASLTDGHAFRCPQCHTYTSLRSGSFFEKSRLPLQKWILLMYLWVREYPIKDAQEEAEVAHETAVSIYRWLREVCSTKLLQTPTVLGGPGIVVQIDESLFRHKPKVSALDLTNPTLSV